MKSEKAKPINISNINYFMQLQSPACTGLYTIIPFTHTIPDPHIQYSSHMKVLVSNQNTNRQDRTASEDGMMLTIQSAHQYWPQKKYGGRGRERERISKKVQCMMVISG